MDHLQAQLHRIEYFITSQASSTTAKKSTYDDILRSRLPESFTDAGLCLKELWLYDYCTFLEDILKEEKARVSLGGRKCLRLLRKVANFSRYQPVRNAGCLGYYDPEDLKKHLNRTEILPPHIWRIVKRLLIGLNSTASVGANNEWRMDFCEASRKFLSAAMRVEKLLAQLKVSTKTAPSMERVEEDMAKMKISRQ